MAAKCRLWNPDDDTPEALIRYCGCKSRNTAVPRSFNLHTDTVMQQSCVTSQQYHEGKLSAKSKLPDFSGSPSEGEPREFEDIKKTKVEPEMLLQPDRRPTSHELLVSEVKGIYANLVMVEAKCIAENEKCIEINERQSSTVQGNGTSKSIHLKDDQWRSLTVLHKQLLHEHHDFFLASEHPSASPALSSRLAAKYAMPTRMWRHGIHAFLEALRYRLPGSFEHMLAFIYIAYPMMALLYETVPTYEETWIRCLGDLGRFSMVIEDDEAKENHIWSNVAQFWYKKASDKSTDTGRLHHHLAIQARPSNLEQLSLYTRSLTCATPFENAKGIIITLFNPVINSRESHVHWSSSLEATCIQAHAISFTRLVDSFYQFERTVAMFGQIGVFAAVANVAALFEYGNAKRRIPTPINTKQLDSALPKPAENFIGRLPEEFLMRGSLYSQWYFPWTWFRVTSVGDHERSPETPSISQPWIDRLLWLGRSFSSLWWCLDYTDYTFRVREQLTSMSKAATRKRLSVNFTLLVPFIASLLPAVRGNPIGNPSKVDATSSIAPSVPLLAASIYVLFAAAALVAAHLLAARNGPIRVWACMMGISAYGWWAVGNDATALQSLSITELSVWAISTFQYGIATFHEFRIPERVLLITVLGAAFLDMAIVSFMTPKGTPISRSDLLSLSLPAMSLSLAGTANLFACFRDTPRSPPSGSEIETRFSMDRGDRYHAHSFHQHSGTTYPSTSEPSLHSPLRTPSANGRFELPAA